MLGISDPSSDFFQVIPGFMAPPAVTLRRRDFRSGLPVRGAESRPRQQTQPVLPAVARPRSDDTDLLWREYLSGTVCCRGIRTGSFLRSLGEPEGSVPEP